MSDFLSVNLSQGLEALSLELETAVQQQMLAFIVLLDKWNRTYNLTAVRNPSQMVARHLLDSLVIGPWLQGEQILDVGTGAGLPGIPLALAYPEKQFTLLDSNSKKTRFVTQAVSELGLKNVSVVQSRIERYQPRDRMEDQGGDKIPARFDTITARAFASLGELVSRAQHLCAEDGIFLIMKGVYPLAEVDDLPAGFTIAAMQQMQVPGLAADRHAVIIKPLVSQDES